MLYFWKSLIHMRLKSIILKYTISIPIVLKYLSFRNLFHLRENLNKTKLNYMDATRSPFNYNDAITRKIVAASLILKKSSAGKRRGE